MSVPNNIVMDLNNVMNQLILLLEFCGWGPRKCREDPKLFKCCQATLKSHLSMEGAKYLYFITYVSIFEMSSLGRSTHETGNPWTLHFKDSHWWKRRSWSNFASRYTWGTNGVCEYKMDVKSTWISTWHQTDNVSCSLGLFSKKPSLRGRPNTKPGDHGTPNAHTRSCWFILICYGWRPAWIKTPLK